MLLFALNTATLTMSLVVAILVGMSAGKGGTSDGSVRLTVGIFLWTAFVSIANIALGV